LNHLAGDPEVPAWSEELVAETLEMQGYAVWRNVPVGSGKGSKGGRGGGRKEADIVAFRLHPKPEVIHAEVGVLWESPTEVARILTSKFDSQLRKSILRRVGETVGPKVKLDYHPRYYTPQRSDNRQFKRALELLPDALDIEIYHIETLIDNALSGWEDWTKRQARLGVVKVGLTRIPRLLGPTSSCSRGSRTPIYWSRISINWATSGTRAGRNRARRPFQRGRSPEVACNTSLVGDLAAYSANGRVDVT
jgi:hypothetical protein